MTQSQTWLTDDIKSLVVKTSDHWTPKNAVQFFGRYGIAVMGDESNGNIHLICAYGDEDWKSLLRIHGQQLSLKEKQQVVDSMTSMALTLVDLRHQQWQFSRSTGLPKKHSKRRGGSASLHIKAANSDERLTLTFDVKRKRALFNQLKSLQQQLQQLKEHGMPQAASLFAGIVGSEPAVSVPQLLLALEPEISGEKIAAVAAQAQQALDAQPHCDYASVVAVLKTILQQEHSKVLTS